MNLVLFGMNLWLSFLEHWHRSVWNWGPTHRNFIQGYIRTYVEQRWIDGGRCSCRMDCAMGGRSSGLVLWLVIQKQSDVVLVRGFGCTWRSFGCRATVRAVYVQVPQEFKGAVSSNVTNTAMLLYIRTSSTSFFKCFQPRWLLCCVSQVPSCSFTADRNLVPNYSIPFPAAGLRC